MATGKAAFVKTVGSEPVAPIPEFPKVPACLKRGKSDADMREIEQWEADIAEFFKKQRQRGL